MLLLLLACADPKDSGATGRSDDTAGSRPTSDPAPFSAPLECPEGTDPPPADTWTPLGPAPGGNARFLAVSPHDPAEAWVGATIGGLFHTTDAGASWRRVEMIGSAPHAVGPLYADPEVPGRVYFSDGIVWQVDGDAGVALPVGGHDPSERVRTVTRAAGRLWAIDLNGVVLASDDEGQSWAEQSRVPGLGGAGAPPPDAAHGEPTLDRYYWTLATTPEGALLAGQHDGPLLRSEDGLGWTPALASDFVLMSLVVGSPIYAGSGSTLWRSDDDGRSFTEVFDAGADLEAVAVSATGAVAVATGHAVTLDGVDRSPGVHGLLGLAWLGDTLLLGHTEGLLATTDGGSSWFDAGTGLDDLDLSALGVHPACPGVLLVGTQCARGLYTSSDGGVTLAHHPEFTHYVMSLAWSPTALGTLWVTVDDQALVSFDGGASFEARTPNAVHLHGLTIDPLDGDHVLAGSVGTGDWADRTGTVYRTEDGGASWVESGLGFPILEGSVQALLALTEPAGLTLAGTYKGGTYHEEGTGEGLFRSVDGGFSWSLVTEYPETGVRYLRDCGVGYGGAAGIGRSLALGSAGLYASTDGITWATLRDGDFRAVACRGDRVVLASSDGVLRSEDGGQTWLDWSDGLGVLGGTEVAELAFSPDGQTVYLAWASVGMSYRSW